MACSVYLADLRHNYGGVLSTDCMPLGVGYMKAVMDRDLSEDASGGFRVSGGSSGRYDRSSSGRIDG